MSQDVQVEDVGVLTPPSSDMSSDSEASSPASPMYEEMGNSDFDSI